MADRIFIARHGATEWSVSGQHTSHTDLPLLEAGREQAVAMAGALGGEKFALVLCSPLLRARDTCRLAGFADVAVTCDDLREWDYGDYEGLTTPQIRERNPAWNLWSDGCPGRRDPGPGRRSGRPGAGALRRGRRGRPGLRPRPRAEGIDGSLVGDGGGGRGSVQARSGLARGARARARDDGHRALEHLRADGE